MLAGEVAWPDWWQPKLKGTLDLMSASHVGGTPFFPGPGNNRRLNLDPTSKMKLNCAVLSLVLAQQAICLLLTLSHLGQNQFYISSYVFPPLFCFCPFFSPPTSFLTLLICLSFLPDSRSDGPTAHVICFDDKELLSTNTLPEKWK